METFNFFLVSGKDYTLGIIARSFSHAESLALEQIDTVEFITKKDYYQVALRQHGVVFAYPRC